MSTALTCPKCSAKRSYERSGATVDQCTGGADRAAAPADLPRPTSSGVVGHWA